MNAPPLLLLVRPEGQSKQLLSECEALFGSSIAAVISPILKINPVGKCPDLQSYQGVIVTSANAVRFAGDLHGIRLYCVGNRTRIAAQQAGADVLFTARDVDALVVRLRAEMPEGRLMYLRGEHVASDLQKSLDRAGLETDSQVIYCQSPRPIGVVLGAAISGDMCAVLPLYSPRSARLLGEGVEGLGAGLHVIAISQTVADVWRRETGGECEICETPDGDEMLGKIVAALRC